MKVYKDVDFETVQWIKEQAEYESGFAHIDPKTGKLTVEHIENCSGCSLCETGD